jgi:hypothetical protein
MTYLERILRCAHYTVDTEENGNYVSEIHMPRRVWRLPFGYLITTGKWYVLTKDLETQDYTTALLYARNALVETFGEAGELVQRVERTMHDR